MKLLNSDIFSQKAEILLPKNGIQFHFNNKTLGHSNILRTLIREMQKQQYLKLYFENFYTSNDFIIVCKHWYLTCWDIYCTKKSNPGVRLFTM